MGVFVSMGPSTRANGPIASSGTTACISAVISHSNLEIHEHSRETARPPPPRLLYQPRTACRLIYCPASAYSVPTSITFPHPCLNPSLLCQVTLCAETLKPQTRPISSLLFCLAFTVAPQTATSKPNIKYLSNILLAFRQPDNFDRRPLRGTLDIRVPAL